MDSTDTTQDATPAEHFPSAPSTNPAATTAPSAGGKGGAPHNNQNALKSGVSAWLKSCKIPRAYRALRRRIKELGQQLPVDVAAIKGRLPNECETIAIERFVRAAGAMALMERWLDQERDNLGISDRLALLKQIDAAGERMSRMLKELGFDVDAAQDPWAAYDAHLARQRAIAAQVDTSATPANNASNSLGGAS